MAPSRALFTPAQRETLENDFSFTFAHPAHDHGEMPEDGVCDQCIKDKGNNRDKGPCQFIPDLLEDEGSVEIATRGCTTCSKANRKCSFANRAVTFVRHSDGKVRRKDNERDASNVVDPRPATKPTATSTAVASATAAKTKSTGLAARGASVAPFNTTRGPSSSAEPTAPRAGSVGPDPHAKRKVYDASAGTQVKRVKATNGSKQISTINETPDVFGDQSETSPTAEKSAAPKKPNNAAGTSRPTSNKAPVPKKKTHPGNQIQSDDSSEESDGDSTSGSSSGSSASDEEADASKVKKGQGKKTGKGDNQEQSEAKKALQQGEDKAEEDQAVGNDGSDKGSGSGEKDREDNQGQDEQAGDDENDQDADMGDFGNGMDIDEDPVVPPAQTRTSAESSLERSPVNAPVTPKQQQPIPSGIGGHTVWRTHVREPSPKGKGTILPKLGKTVNGDKVDRGGQGGKASARGTGDNDSDKEDDGEDDHEMTDADYINVIPNGTQSSMLVMMGRCIHDITEPLENRAERAERKLERVLDKYTRSKNTLRMEKAKRADSEKALEEIKAKYDALEKANKTLKAAAVAHAIEKKGMEQRANNLQEVIKAYQDGLA